MTREQKKLLENPEIVKIIKFLRDSGSRTLEGDLNREHYYGEIEPIRTDQHGRIQNFQKMGLDPFDLTNLDHHGRAGLSDMFMNLTEQPSILNSLIKVLQGAYDPKSEANLSGTKDYESTRKVDALTTTVDALLGDEKNILDIISTLQPSEEQLQQEKENPIKVAN